MTLLRCFDLPIGLRDRKKRRLTKREGRDALTYFGISLADHPRAREIRLSEWNDLSHCYQPAEYDLDAATFVSGRTVMGPMVAAEGDGGCLFVAYEHGSQVPDAFVEFALDSSRSLECRAVKGNYFAGQPVDGFSTIWFQLACAPGDIDDCARVYRDFVLHHFAERSVSRRPFVYYNTWNLQERSKYIDRRETSDPLRTELVLAEIERAHRMGVDVFVIDAGWQKQPGDWEIDTNKFPDGLSSIRAALDRARNAARALVQSQRGRGRESHLPGAQRLRDGLERPERRLGCGEPPHVPGQSFRRCHGRLAHRVGQGDRCHVLQVGRGASVRMRRCRARPRYPGQQRRGARRLLRLSTCSLDGASGRETVCSLPRGDRRLRRDRGPALVRPRVSVGWEIFLLNNGPYYENFDAPLPESKNWNLFFQPGPARGWICRSGLAFDRWIPSVLFLTHFFPDDDETKGWTMPFWTVSGRRPASGEDQQMMSLASLVLGPGGIWGDLGAGLDRGTIALRLDSGALQARGRRRDRGFVGAHRIEGG